MQVENHKTNPKSPSAENDAEDFGDPNLNDDLVGDDPSSRYGYGDVSLAEIRELYQKVNAMDRPDEEALLKILDEAARFEKKHQDAESYEKYMEVMEKIGGKKNGGDPTGELGDFNNDENDGKGEAPTRVENGVNYYEAKTPKQDFELTDKGDGSQNVITTDGNVTLKPKDPVKDEVRLSSEGDFIVAEFTHEGKKTTWKISKKVKNLHLAIDADKVKGNYGNLKAKVTVGYDSKMGFVKKGDRDAMADLIQGGVEKIGYVTHMPMSGFVPTTIEVGVGDGGGGSLLGNGNAIYMVGWHGEEGNKNASEKADGYAKGIAEEGKKLLSAIAEAVRSNDPEDWKKAKDILQHFKSNDEYGGKNTNNLAQLVFNALYGELGEDQFKFLLKTGAMDPEFAKSFAEKGLLASSEENTNMTTEITQYQQGGSGWTHQTSADFITDNIGKNISKDEEE